MNRSAMCIRMLQLLKSRGFMTREEIAAELETNVRNIAEYRKELECAGYAITSLSGKYGGYALQQDALLPALALNDQEKQSLREMQTYLRSHTDFMAGKSVSEIIDRLLSNTPLQKESTGFYIEQEQGVLSDTLRSYIKLMKQAMKESRCVEISYRSLTDQRSNSFVIHPYELIHYKGAYYCIAYSIRVKAFRTFKFSEERMKKCVLSDHHFNRDPHFDISQHIGMSGLIKEEAVAVDLLVYEEAAIYMAERQIGLHPHFTWVDDSTLRYQTIFEGKKEALSFVLSLGAKAKIISPTELKDTLTTEIKKLTQLYQEEA